MRSSVVVRPEATMSESEAGQSSTNSPYAKMHLMAKNSRRPPSYAPNNEWPAPVERTKDKRRRHSENV
jgi:hypothetical protein